ncbi:FGGY-family carbohydrate kinase [Dysosmobacter sp.]
MKHYLMVDLGTGNTRVALVSSCGSILGIRTYTNVYHRDSAYEDAQYFLPEEWAPHILQGCRELCREHPGIRVDAVSAAGARQSFVLLDRQGRAFYGLPNIDNRGRGYMDRVPEHEEIYRLSGKWATEDFGAAKLMGLRAVYPERYGAIDKITSLSEWIAWMFTGRAVMEYSQACESQLYEIGRRTWSESLCRFYGLDMDILPPLQAAGTVVGPVLPELREKLCLAPEAVFILGGADTQAALRQTGIGPGDIAVVSGTTSPVVTEMDRLFYDPGQRVWTDAGLGAENYQVEMNPGVTGLNYQRIRESLYRDWTYGQLEEAYEKKTSFACTASFSSLLFYQRRSLRRGGFFMGAPLGAELDRVDLIWAVLADIACSIYEQLASLAELTDNRGRCILGCGGGFQSRALCQMLADLSGRELRLRPGFSQATVLGLTALCNDCLGQTQIDGSGEELRYAPRKDQLIHRYYPVWLENRNRANNA